MYAGHLCTVRVPADPVKGENALENSHATHDDGAQAAGNMRNRLSDLNTLKFRGEGARRTKLRELCSAGDWHTMWTFSPRNLNGGGGGHNITRQGSGGCGDDTGRGQAERDALVDASAAQEYIVGAILHQHTLAEPQLPEPRSRSRSPAVRYMATTE
jgi:hypothetical protein